MKIISALHLTLCVGEYKRGTDIHDITALAEGIQKDTLSLFKIVRVYRRYSCVRCSTLREKENYGFNSCPRNI